MNTTELFVLQIMKGWLIEKTSCTCGGLYAWLKPTETGSYEMVGCICHTVLDHTLNVAPDKKVSNEN